MSAIFLYEQFWCFDFFYIQTKVISSSFAFLINDSLFEIKVSVDFQAMTLTSPFCRECKDSGPSVGKSYFVFLFLCADLQTTISFLQSLIPRFI